MSGKFTGNRDTAKDIILGTAPSGAAPRTPREGRLQNGAPPIEPPRTPAIAPSPRNTPSVDPTLYSRLTSSEKEKKQLSRQLGVLSENLRNIQAQHQQQLIAEKDSRRALEDTLRRNQEAMARMSASIQNGSNNTSAAELEEVKRGRAALEAQVLRLTQELTHMRSMVDRQGNDMLLLNTELKSRPVIDPSKMNNTQHLETRVRDLHGELMGVRQGLDNELNERRRNDQEHAINLSRLQSQLQSQESNKSQLLQQLQLKGNESNAKLSEESKRLNNKISLITDEVTKNLAAKEQAIRDENHQKYQALEKAIKAELEARLQYERDVKTYLENKWKTYSDEIEEIKGAQQGDKSKYKDRFQKLNESVAVLEKHLEQGNKKMDRVVAAEIQSRKLHEKGLLVKLGEIEDKLLGHTSNLSKALTKKKDVPNLDTDALRREMEVIAADKHKLSMEGLLKLEEKMQRIEKGVDRDSKEIKEKITNTSSSAGDAGDNVSRIKHQLQKLDDTQEDIEKAHNKIKEKVERQIPEDLNELAMKVDNAKKQLNDRIDREEQERYLAVKELQDEITKLRSGGVMVGGAAGAGGAGAAGAAGGKGPSNASLAKEVEECKIGIKKLAEAVTTVKNVLDRRINEETRTRERDLERITQRAAGAFRDNASARSK